MTEDIVALAREAGVVGAGGAGFPTHVKLAGRAEVVLANGASCEPLLLSDPHLLEQETASVLEGLRLAMARVGAGRGVVCLKGKHQEALARVRGACAGDPSLAVFVLDDFYPAGDEHVLVHEVTGRVVPEAGLPIAVGVLVQNVETLRNLARAREEAAARGEAAAREVEAHQDFLVRRLFAYVKFYDEGLSADDDRNYYMEREWRVHGVLAFTLADVRRVVFPERFAKSFRADLPEYYGEITFS